ncbi:hypothetical protein [Dongshaea marina]|uniref:hypothetical protein n=1 Tax=Dongshaea marina TaxID=2047966 RepID=UPI000D3E5869|nr:hypothetical protein [Dongshaea marina]
MSDNHESDQDKNSFTKNEKRLKLVKISLINFCLLTGLLITGIYFYGGLEKININGKALELTKEIQAPIYVESPYKIIIADGSILTAGIRDSELDRGTHNVIIQYNKHYPDFGIDVGHMGKKVVGRPILVQFRAYPGLKRVKIRQKNYLSEDDILRNPNKQLKNIEVVDAMSGLPLHPINSEYVDMDDLTKEIKEYLQYGNTHKLS